MEEQDCSFWWTGGESAHTTCMCQFVDVNKILGLQSLSLLCCPTKTHSSDQHWQRGQYCAANIISLTFLDFFATSSEMQLVICCTYTVKSKQVIIPLRDVWTTIKLSLSRFSDISTYLPTLRLCPSGLWNTSGCLQSEQSVARCDGYM